MTERLANERGSAMVLTLGVLTVLALLAVVLLGISVSEKRTAFSEYTNSRSFYSADAASEAGVNWLRHQPTPPDEVDSLSDVRVANTLTTLHAQSRYKYDVQFVRKRFRPGWSVEYKDYEYRVNASGVSAEQSATEVELNATRLYREGY